MIGCLYSRYKESSYSKYHRDTSTEGEGGGHTPHSALLTMMHSAHTGGLVGGYLVSETVRARKPSHKGPRICDGKAHKTRRSSTQTSQDSRTRKGGSMADTTGNGQRGICHRAGPQLQAESKQL